MHYIKSPHLFNDSPRPWLFLAGSVGKGSGGTWRGRVIAALAKANFSGSVLNPAIEFWEHSGEPADREPGRTERIGWELSALEQADRLLMHFSSESESPITLLELGLAASTQRVVVSCEPRFWKRDNVLAVCKRYVIPVIARLEDFTEHVPGLSAKGDSPSGPSHDKRSHL